MNDEKYNLFYVFNRLINDTNDSVETILARYFIQNFYRAKNFNIYDIAADCNVSRSSIRRFAERLGYKNFRNLKEVMIKNAIQSKSVKDSIYRQDITNSITAIVNELNGRMDTDQVDIICDRIRQCNNFYIICSGSSLSAVKDFQVKLAAKGRLSQLIHGDEKVSYLVHNSQVNDCILIITVSGKIGIALKPDFKSIESDTILLTVNRIDEFEDVYQKCYYMSHLDHSKDPNLYRKYGLNYVLDIIANHY